MSLRIIHNGEPKRARRLNISCEIRADQYFKLRGKGMPEIREGDWLSSVHAGQWILKKAQEMARRKNDQPPQPRG